MTRKVRFYATVCSLWLSAFTIQSAPFDPDATLTLELEQVSIVTALNMIASQNDLNLVISGDVSGDVTLRLQDVGIEAALDAILTANNYNYFIKNSVILVKPVTSDAIGELVTRTVFLRYADANTVFKAMESLKTGKGEVVVLEPGKASRPGQSAVKPTGLILVDYPIVVEQMLSVIVELDQPLRQVSIEVKIIETKVDSKSKIGFSWPASFNLTSGSVAQSGSGTSTTGQSATNGSNDQSGSSFTGIYDPNDGSWTWGTLSVTELQLVLDAMNESGNSKLISNPHITTLENHEAEIKSSTIIPIPTISRFTESAATTDIVTFEDEEVGITLRVIPRINGDGTVTLNVNPEVEDIIGFTGPSDSQKPITSSRSVKTQITVADGETAALGGLLKESDINKERKVPLLGSIPLLGKLLFTNKSTDKVTTDLIILITPKIIP
ncbi:MAG: hypothetical protein ACE5FH_01740 [Candidatus Zixiibacteriota bacterium]